MNEQAFRKAAIAAREAADGDSNDTEIQALQEAVSEAELLIAALSATIERVRHVAEHTDNDEVLNILNEGQADTASSASRQHYIDTGEYLPLK